MLYMSLVVTLLDGNENRIQHISCRTIESHINLCYSIVMTDLLKIVPQYDNISNLM